MNDIRWKQRLDNFSRSLKHLEEAVEIEMPSIVQKAGVIQFFEISFELGWKTLKDYLEAEGFYEIKSPKSTLKKAFEIGVLKNGHLWLEALQSRDLAAHTYDDAKAEEIYELICHSYFPLLEELKSKLESIGEKE